MVHKVFLIFHWLPFSMAFTRTLLETTSKICTWKWMVGSDDRLLLGFGLFSGDTWWKKSCTSRYGKYPTIYPSQLLPDFFHQGLTKNLSLTWIKAIFWVGFPLPKIPLGLRGRVTVTALSTGPAKLWSHRKKTPGFCMTWTCIVGHGLRNWAESSQWSDAKWG